MNRTETAVRRMLAAIEAPLYDVGVLSDRGMLPGLDSLPAEAVLARLPLLRYRNARGSHIYIRPSGAHRFTVLDDLTEGSLARLSADGFDPCAAIETSPGNFQAWLRHTIVFPKLLGTFAAQTLAARYRGRSQRRRLETLRPAPRLHQLQTQTPQAGRTVSICPTPQPHRKAVLPGRSLRTRDRYALPGAGA